MATTVGKRGRRGRARKADTTGAAAHIRIRGARVHNLRGIDVDLPRDAITVITGVSGSGKSSLAFDTLYAEGQRQYIDSLSAYARQFLDQIPRPDVDSIEGLAPTLAIDQKLGSSGGRSTVATVTEIYDYLRLLYARAGTPHCVACGTPVKPQSAETIREQLAALNEGTRLMLLSPMVRGRRGKHAEVFESIRAAGLIRARVDGEIYPLEEVPELAPRRNHTIEALVDRIVVRDGFQSRLHDSLMLGLRLGDGVVTSLVERPDGQWRETLHSTALACPECGESVEELEPRTFSFNSPYGACEACGGLGRAEVRGKTIVCPACTGARLRPQARGVTVEGLSISELVAQPLDAIAERLEGFPTRCQGIDAVVAAPICGEVVRRLAFLIRVGVGYLTLDRAADSLSGGELQRVRLATSIGSGLVGVCYVLDEPSIGLHPADHERLLESIRALRNRGNTIVIVEHDEATIRAADRLIDVGPGAGSHGGRIISQGSPGDVAADPKSLTGKYLRGERAVPIPAHRRLPPDDRWLVLADVTTHNLKNVRTRFPLGTLIGVSGVSGSGKSSLINDTLAPLLVEAIASGPAPAGRNGTSRRSTPSRPRDGRADGRRADGRRADRRAGAVHEAAPSFLLGRSDGIGGRLVGAEPIDKLIRIDQAPIGRTPRSCPATYTGALDPIRRVFAATREAKTRGYDLSRFSFNAASGRCEQCGGHGVERIEMNFLSDLFVTCTRCGGKRFNRQTLQVRFKGATIADVLEMSIEQAAAFFESVPKVDRILRSLIDVGLGYLSLGQSSTTLSGGEAQRIKLATELARPTSGQTFYLLDEPTTGLHFEDIARLVRVLQRLVDQGNTVVVIEHQFDLLAACDWVIDLGPEGGVGGGHILAEGPPEQIADVHGNATGRFLREVLHSRGSAPATAGE